MSDLERVDYMNQLNVAGNGIMGYIEIPLIHCSLPVYHGTSDSVLQVAVGHLSGTSLPVGGAGTHCVVSGHRGLPSAKLFTDLDQLKEGDTFMFYILDEIFTYEVDQIHIVEPEDVTHLAIEEGKDLVTMITCTPYGVNSHRLLVRGHRIDNIVTKTVHVSSDAIQIEPMIVAPIVAAPILLSMLIYIISKDIYSKHKGKKFTQRLNQR
jgi:sortase A